MIIWKYFKTIQTIVERMEDDEKNSFRIYWQYIFDATGLHPKSYNDAITTFEGMYVENKDLFDDIMSNITKDNILTSVTLNRWDEIQNKYVGMDVKKIEEEIETYFKDDAIDFNEKEFINAIPDEEKTLNMHRELDRLIRVDRKLMDKHRKPVMECQDSLEDDIEYMKEEFLIEIERMSHNKMILYQRISSFLEQKCSEDGVVARLNNFITPDNSECVKGVNEKFIRESKIYFSNQIAEFEVLFENVSEKDMKSIYLEPILRMKTTIKEWRKCDEIFEQENGVNKRINQLIQDNVKDGKKLLIPDIRLRSMENEGSIKETTNWINSHDGDRKECSDLSDNLFFAHLLITFKKENYKLEKLTEMREMWKRQGFLNCMYLTFSHRESKALRLAMQLCKEAEEFIMQHTLSFTDNNKFKDSMIKLNSTKKDKKILEKHLSLRRCITSMGGDKEMVTDVKRIQNTLDNNDQEILKINEQLDVIEKRSEELLNGGSVLCRKSLRQAKLLIFHYKQLRTYLKELSMKYNDEEDRLKNESARIKKKFWILFMNDSEELERMFDGLSCQANVAPEPDK